MKVTYWKAECLVDSDCCSIRERRRRDVIARLRSDDYGLTLIDGAWCDDNGNPIYDQPVKVQIEYTNAFDLAMQLTGPGGDSMFADMEN